jgi:hypothetical protein
MARVCPVCTTDHPETAERCSHCGSVLAARQTASAGDDADAYLRERSQLMRRVEEAQRLADGWGAYLADQQAAPDRKRAVTRPTLDLGEVQARLNEAQASLERFDGHAPGTAG